MLFGNYGTSKIINVIKGIQKRGWVAMKAFVATLY